MKKQYRLFKRNRVWYYKLPAEKTFHTTDQTNKTLAEAYVIELIKKNDRAREESQPITLQEYARSFFVWDECSWIKEQLATGHSFSPRTAQMRRGHLTNHVFPKFGDHLLTDLKSKEIQIWIIGLPLSSQTHKHIHNTLNIVLREAKREKLISENPMDDVKRVVVQFEERKPFSLDEISLMFPSDRDDLLLIWKSPYWASLFFTLLTSGMRSGEIRALKWKHIDWKLNGILVLQAVKSDDTIGPTKSGQERGILVPGRTLNLLAWWRDCSEHPEDKDFVYYGLGKENAYLERGTIAENLKSGMIRAGIDPQGRTQPAFGQRFSVQNRVLRQLQEDHALVQIV